MSSLQAILKTEFSFIANTSGKILTFLLILLAAYVWFPTGVSSDATKLTIVMIAGLCGNIAMTGLTWWYARKHVWVGFRFDAAYILHILRVSLPYGLALFLGVIFFKIDIILLSVMENPQDADSIIALYALPMKIVEVGMMYGIIFLNSFLPVLTASIEAKQTDETQKLTKRGFEILIGFGAGLACFLFFFSGEAIRVISTEAFFVSSFFGYTAVDALQIVAWIFLFYFLASLANYILIAEGAQKKILYINSIIACINIVGNIIFIPHFSFIGAAWVTLVTQMLLVVMSLWLVRHTYKAREMVKRFVYLVGSALVSGYIALLCVNTLFPVSQFGFEEAFLRGLVGGICFGFLYLALWWGIYKIFPKKIVAQ